jgi:hypothetical protein
METPPPTSAGVVVTTSTPAPAGTPSTTNTPSLPVPFLVNVTFGKHSQISSDHSHTDAN